MIARLEGLIAIDRLPALDAVLAEPLLCDLVEHRAEAVEHGSGYHEFVLAEGLEGGAQARLEARAPLLDKHAPIVGERREHDAPVAVGTLPLDEPRRRESFEHLGDARRAQIRDFREVAQRHLTLVSKAEQQAVLGVGELARTVGFAPTQPSHRGHSALERTSQVLARVAPLARACVSKRDWFLAGGGAHAAIASASVSSEGGVADPLRARALRSARNRITHGMIARAVIPAENQNAVP